MSQTREQVETIDLSAKELCDYLLDTVYDISYADMLYDYCRKGEAGQKIVVEASEIMNRRYLKAVNELNSFKENNNCCHRFLFKQNPHERVELEINKDKTKELSGFMTRLVEFYQIKNSSRFSRA